MIDGLYRVVHPKFVAGFVVEGGEVTECAPILRKRIDYWRTVAELVNFDAPRQSSFAHDPNHHEVQQVTEPSIESLKATVGFSRKVNLGDYQSADYSVFVPVEISPELAALIATDPTEGRVKLAEALREAWLCAKGSVFEQAGLPFKYDAEGGVIVEMLEANFPGTKAENKGGRPASSSATRSGSQQRVGARSQGGASRGNDPSPKAKLEGDAAWSDLVNNPTKWFDNRGDKRNAKAPDFKRKGTGEGLWLESREGVPEFVEQSWVFETDEEVPF